MKKWESNLFFSFQAEPANYEYQYAVKDEYSGVNIDASEAQDGYATTGGYSVVLPDGRTQRVTYTVADDVSGYVADVQYDGEAKYEEYKPSYKHYQPKSVSYTHLTLPTIYSV